MSSAVKTNTNVFKFAYSKPDMKQLIGEMTSEPFCFTNGQLYSPINEVFLKLNDTNAQSTTFNYDIMAKSVITFGEENYNDDDDNNSEQSEQDQLGGFATLLCVNTQTKKEIEKQAFIKFSPLLDPIRYLVGKYDIDDATLKEIPLFNNTNSHPKVRNQDNSSYVDGMFSFLSSKMLHHHGIINALDCYGSLIGHKKRFTIDAVDDMDYLLDNEFFIRNNNILYETSNEFYNQVANHGSRSNKLAIKIHDTDDDHNDIDIDDITTEINELNTVFSPNNVDDNNKSHILTLNDISDISELSDFEGNIPSKRSRNGTMSSNNTHTKTAKSGSTSCSSRTSHTDCSSIHSNIQDETEIKSKSNTETDTCNDDGDTVNKSYSSGDCSSEESDDAAFINIYDFPVNAIFLEKCEATLDYLCSEDEDFGSEELCAALMQVIMTLIAYHKCFDFQHNDLHTNNIMYVPTKKQYLYYKVNGLNYKVPTYGRIFKIIDFGRATYKYRGNQLCSDSFHKEGDAHSQFNFGRCYNPSRPIVEPNNSFDLCRLGTSLIDFLIDELEEVETTKDPVILMVADWCKDDNDRNVLWKSNGDERYPGFKLYKMISRTVSKHTPISQLERPILERYKCSRKNIKKGTNVMNIDALPSYISAAPRV